MEEFAAFGNLLVWGLCSLCLGVVHHDVKANFLKLGRAFVVSICWR